MRRRCEAERRDGSACTRNRGPTTRGGLDAFVVGQLDRYHVTVGTRDDAAHLPVADVHPANRQSVELGAVHFDRVVKNNG